MEELNIPSWEELRQARAKNRLAFAQRFCDKIQEEQKRGQPLSNAQLHALDLCAEDLGLSIDKIDQVLTNYFGQFCEFLGAGKCSHVDSAFFMAEGMYIEQFLGKQDKDSDDSRYWNQHLLSLLREKLSKREDELIDLADMVVDCFECNLGWLWESHDVPNKFGRMIHCVGHKESRELMRDVRSFKL